MRLLLAILGGLVAVVVVAVIAGMWWISTAGGRDWAVGHVSERVGRDIVIEDLSVDWAWHPEIRVTGLRLANAEWARSRDLMRADRVAFRIHPWPLLRGDIVLDYLTLQAPQIDLERGPEGRGNWSFWENPAAATAAEAVSPEDRDDAPRIGRLEIRDGRLAYRDPEAFLAIIDAITQSSITYLRGQIDAGAEAVQIFDSFTAARLSAPDTDMKTPVSEVASIRSGAVTCRMPVSCSSWVRTASA